MRKRAWLGVFSACVVSCVPSVSFAIHHSSHGVLDLRAALTAAPNPFEDHYVDTGCLGYLPSGECGKYGIRDRALVKGISPAVDLLGWMWVEDDDSLGPPPPPGNLRVTTIYGVDANPGSPHNSAQMTGFNSASPEAIFSEEIYVGLTQEYVASSLGTIQLNELGTVFPAFDFSHIVGDPSSVVYAFSAVVPASDFARIPEPTSAILMGAGLLFGLLVARRRIAVRTLAVS